MKKEWRVIDFGDKQFKVSKFGEVFNTKTETKLKAYNNNYTLSNNDNRISVNKAYLIRKYYPETIKRIKIIVPYELDHIINCVCSYMNFDVNHIHQKSKDSEITYIRQLVTYIANEKGINLHQINKALNLKRSLFYNNIKKMKGYMLFDKSVKKDVDNINIEVDKIYTEIPQF